ncbi:MAG: hypothetical protein M0D55_14745 [Elusimicrobiota bacterium]|nr:MAG: hypothetical protein M0D55_14745 [Elusimicrobiota bacterium]
MTRALLIFCVAFLLSACRGEKDPVIARVGKLKITQSEFQRKLSEVSAGYQDYVLSPSGRRQFLDVLIREKLVLAAAQQSDVPRSGDFRAQLEKLRREEEDRVREGGDYLLTSMWIDDLRRRGELKVDESDVRDYLLKHPVEVEMRHVLLGTPEAAAEVAKKLRAGANFAKVAKEQSLDAATAGDGESSPRRCTARSFPSSKRSSSACASARSAARSRASSAITS